ncbi:hypothetical protein ACET7N_00210 [Aeromonas veronii]
MSEGTPIDLGTIGMGIPIIYRDVVSKILSYHIAIESALEMYIEKNNISSEKQFFARLRSVEENSGNNDWSIEACKKLNKIRNSCVHIDSKEYKNLQKRIDIPTQEFINFVSKYNVRHSAHKMSNFDWACTLTYQRIYEILNLEYDDLILGEFARLPNSLARNFQPI